MSLAERRCDGCGKTWAWTTRHDWRGPSSCPHCGAVLAPLEVKIDPRDVAPMITAEREAAGELRDTWARDETIQDCPAHYVHYVGQVCVKCGRKGEPLEPL